MSEVRPFVDFDSLDGFRDKPMHIGVALPVRAAHHVHRDAVDENGKVRPVVGIKTAKSNLVGFAAAVMLADDQSRVSRMTSLGVFDGRSSRSAADRVCSVATNG
jgi:hypothetical protein